MSLDVKEVTHFAEAHLLSKYLRRAFLNTKPFEYHKPLSVPHAKDFHLIVRLI